MFAVLQKFLAGMNGRWSSLGTPMRLLIVVFAVLVFSLAAPWLNELFFYVLARSYVDDIADVFDLNKHLAKAITLVVGVTAAYLAWKTFSLSAGRRKIGYFGILGLLIGYSLLLWYGTKGHFFDPKGNSIKCYVLTHAGEVRYGEHPGIDPTTGRPCRPVTPELIDLLEEYRKGRRPQRITSSSPTFFDPRSSEPSVWYFTDRDGAIEIFDLMGFHPETGRSYNPSREISLMCGRLKMHRRNGSAIRRGSPSSTRSLVSLAFGIGVARPANTSSTIIQGFIPGQESRLP